MSCCDNPEDWSLLTLLDAGASLTTLTGALGWPALLRTFLPHFFLQFSSPSPPPAQAACSQVTRHTQTMHITPQAPEHIIGSWLYFLINSIGIGRLSKEFEKYIRDTPVYFATACERCTRHVHWAFNLDIIFMSVKCIGDTGWHNARWWQRPVHLCPVSACDPFVAGAWAGESGCQPGPHL